MLKIMKRIRILGALVLLAASALFFAPLQASVNFDLIQRAKLASSDGAANDLFGQAVTIGMIQALSALGGATLMGMRMKVRSMSL